jgi:hypothetical protein
VLFLGLPSGEILYFISERDEAVKIQQLYELTETMFKKDIDDMSDTVNVLICMPVS